MPIYEYRCCGCNEVFEVFQGHRDAPPQRHRCGATEVVRVLSRTSFRLVGDGWYQSDYGGRPKAPSDDAGAKSDQGAAAEKKADGQPPAPQEAGKTPAATPAGGDGGKVPAKASAPAAKADGGRAKGSDRAG